MISVIQRHQLSNRWDQPDFGRDMPDKPFLTIGEVAGLLQVSNRTVYNLIYKGTLRACRITYHTTLITKEDFFLMIKGTTYCKRSVSVFAKQREKDKEENERRKTGHRRNQHFPTRGKEKNKGQPDQTAAHSGGKLQAVRARYLYGQGLHRRRPLYNGGDMPKVQLYLRAFLQLPYALLIPCVKANSTKCFPKAEVDKAMAEEEERLGNNLSEHWYSCFDIMRLFGLGKTQVRRFALTHGVRTKRIHGNRLYYLKADWDAARKEAERKSSSTKAKREE